MTVSFSCGYNKIVNSAMASIFLSHKYSVVDNVPLASRKVGNCICRGRRRRGGKVLYGTVEDRFDICLSLHTYTFNSMANGTHALYSTVI